MIVDLSLPLGEDTLVYPGDPEIRVRPWAFIDRDGYYMNSLKMGEHSGTHVDAPAHFIPGGKTVDELPLEKFIGNGLVIDVRNGEGPVKLDEIPDSGYYDRIVLFLTGGRELSPEVALFLAAEGVKAVGTDAMSIGNESVHTILLSGEIPIFENLTNLEEVLGTEFVFIALPLKIEGGSGSPVRAVAILEE
ncbi:cyclase family protein [Thermococcus waiotapuensis]|uniref:Cyclase family protein n=1 Tax=Thermococcus waiotapuensis TaxID=90909 RepID=A0AAE4SY72_9EURY|nr:cyclase family protein [Thermococcus waiotapuensis]MDV3103419.1 cyclase family protein [Thermococcus waiotapuensis]